MPQSDERRRVDRLIDPEYVGDLPDKETDELRAMKAECTEVETEVSYVRRLAQGRIDILEAERDRRASGGSLSDLVAALPRILADESRPGPGSTRLLSIFAPDPSIDFRRGMEHLISDSTLAKLPDLSDDELGSSIEQLRELEHQASGMRHALHEVIDGIDAELRERLTPQT